LTSSELTLIGADDPLRSPSLDASLPESDPACEDFIDAVAALADGNSFVAVFDMADAGHCGAD
jgi:hypothetical protein